MQQRLAVSHDYFRVIPTLIEALGYALFQEGFGVVQRLVCVWSTSARSKNHKVWWGLASGLCCLELAVWSALSVWFSSSCHPWFLGSSGNTHPLQRCA
jgi:hypothetical protein